MFIRFKEKGFRRFSQRGASREQLKEIEKQIRKNPESSKGYLERGNYKLRKHCYIDAIIDYNKAIRLNCSSLEVYYSRAKAKEGMSYYQGALADYDYILGRNPGDIRASKGKSVILERLR